MIKVIASDMDGTLLNSAHEISEGNRNAIKKAINKGVKFVIATGRDYDSVHQLAEKNGLECEFVLMNGAEYRDKNGKLIEKIDLDKSKTKDIVNIMHKHGLCDKIFTNDGMYTTCTEEESMKGMAFQLQVMNPKLTFEEAMEEAHLFNGMNAIKYITDIDEFLNRDIEIRKIFGFHTEVSVLDETKKEVEALGDLAILSSFATNIEVTDIKAQKGFILGKVVDEMGISRDEIMILGDSFNDYSLFTEFKNSFAMENAMEHIKEIATYITDTNDNDGVAKAIYKMIPEIE